MKNIIAILALTATSLVMAMPVQLQTDFSEVKDIVERVEAEKSVNCDGKNVLMIPGITKNKTIRYKCRGVNTKFRLNIKTKFIKINDGYKFEVQKYTISSLIF